MPITAGTSRIGVSTTAVPMDFIQSTQDASTVVILVSREDRVETSV